MHNIEIKISILLWWLTSGPLSRPTARAACTAAACRKPLWWAASQTPWRTGLVCPGRPRRTLTKSTRTQRRDESQLQWNGGVSRHSGGKCSVVMKTLGLWWIHFPLQFYRWPPEMLLTRLTKKYKFSRKQLQWQLWVCYPGNKGNLF